MALQADFEGHITSEPGAYTWDDVVALNSPLVIPVNGSNDVYRLAGRFEMGVGARLTILNKTLFLNGGRFITLDNGVVNFGEETNARNGCNLILDRASGGPAITNGWTPASGFTTTSQINFYGCTIEIHYPPAARHDVKGVSKLIDCFVKAFGTTSDAGFLYLQPNAVIKNTIFKGIGGIELPANATIEKVTFKECLSTFFNTIYSLVNIADLEVYSVGRSFLSNTGGYRFIDSAIDLTNGNTIYGGTGGFEWRSFKAFRHYLKIAGTNINNTLVSYLGATNQEQTTNASGSLAAFVLDVENTNYQLTNGNIQTASTAQYTRAIKNYAHLPIEETLNVNSKIGTEALPFTITLLADAGVTATFAAAGAITGISHTANSITVTGSRTLDQIYDSRKAYWRSTQSALPLSWAGRQINLGNITLVVNGGQVLSGTKFDSLLTASTYQLTNGGVLAVPIQDGNGIRFRFYGLPTSGNPVLRLIRSSDNAKTYFEAIAGECYLTLDLNTEYTVRADAYGFIRSEDIAFNTNQSLLQLPLKPLLNSDGSSPLTGAIAAESNCVAYDYTNHRIVVSYDAAHPAISSESALAAVGKYLSGYYNTAGLDVDDIIVGTDGKLIFSGTSPTRIRADANNTGIPFLNFEIVHSGYDTPHLLFDFANGKVFHYVTTQNLAKFSGNIDVGDIDVDVDLSPVLAQIAVTNTRLTSARAASLDTISSLATSAALTAQAISIIQSIPTVAQFWAWGDRALTSYPTIPVPPTPGAIAQATRTELANELARIDQPISSRLSSADITGVAQASELAKLVALLKVDSSGFTSTALSATPAVNFTSVLNAIALIPQNNWGYSSRTLSSGANISLAKGTGVTGFNDLNQGDVAIAAAAAIDSYQPAQRSELARLTALLKTNGSGFTATALADTPQPNLSALTTAIEASAILAKTTQINSLQAFITPYLQKLYIAGGHDPTNPISAIAPTPDTPGWVRSQDLSIDQTHTQSGETFTLHQQ